MKRKLFFVLFISIFSVECYANGFEHIFDMFRESIEVWESKSFYAGFIPVCIALLGATTAVIQAIDKKSVKIFTAIIGIVVATTVTIKDSYFYESKISLDNKIAKVKAIEARAKILINDPNISNVQKQIKMLNYLSSFEEISKQDEFGIASNDYGINFSLTTSAYAADIQDNQSMYKYTGIGVDEDINNATEMADYDVLQTIYTQVNDTIRTKISDSNKSSRAEYIPINSLKKLITKTKESFDSSEVNNTKKVKVTVEYTFSKDTFDKAVKIFTEGH